MISKETTKGLAEKGLSSTYNRKQSSKKTAFFVDSMYIVCRNSEIDIRVNLSAGATTTLM